MANFDEAFSLTDNSEGGYSYHKNDMGGETYRGISRVFHNSWQGWRIIDSLKNDPDFPGCLKSNDQLNELVKAFYKREFWNRIKGDQINYQSLANELYDNAVNMGFRSAIKYFQKSINLLNRNQKLYPDIIVDGTIGDVTFNAADQCIKYNSLRRLLNVINSYQTTHYITRMETEPVQEVFVGWFDRVKIY